MVSIYDHVLSVEILEMDACMTCFVASWDKFVHQLPVPKNHKKYGHCSHGDC